jgi:hypothetical protein
LIETPKERDHLEVLVVDGRIIFKLKLYNNVVGRRLHSSGLYDGSGAGFYEHRN